jgi:hippurate hydrolase
VVDDGRSSARASEADRTSAVERVLAGWDDLRAWQEETYRTLHRHPELSHQETSTARLVADVLREAGYEVQDGIGSTGVIGVLRVGDGPVVLVRADMDGLPMAETTGLDYASTDTQADTDGAEVPVAHACGHDVHVACLLGAARLLAAARTRLSGTFVALFQPAEERGTGARSMVDDGLIGRLPAVDVVLAQHVLAYPAGDVGTREGAVLSTAASLRVTLHGRGGHGSMPHLAVDPVVLASSIVVRLQAVVAREVAPGTFAVLTVGRIAAGTKSNIIADRAVLELNIRAYDSATP